MILLVKDFWVYSFLQNFLVSTLEYLIREQELKRKVLPACLLFTAHVVVVSQQGKAGKKSWNIQSREHAHLIGTVFSKIVEYVGTSENWRLKQSVHRHSLIRVDLYYKTTSIRGQIVLANISHGCHQNHTTFSKFASFLTWSYFCQKMGLRIIVFKIYFDFW